MAIAREATRVALSVDNAARLAPNCIYAVGNAPTKSGRCNVTVNAAHAHDYTYSAAGATITASYTDGYGITEGLTLNISSPTATLVAYGTTTFSVTLNDARQR